MNDPLRTLLDALLASLDEPGASRTALADGIGFSPDHVDRIILAAAGESATVMRRRLLLERAAWQLQRGATVTQAAGEAGYGSTAAFSRAFSRAFGIGPRRFGRGTRSFTLPASNGVHFHPPGGLALPPQKPGVRTAAAVFKRLLDHHLAHSRELLTIAATLGSESLDRPLRPGQVISWFDGEEPTVALMAERLVAMLEVWNAAISGTEPPDVGSDLLVRRFDAAAEALNAWCRRIDREGRWDAAFVDAVCRPPELFVYADVIAHILEYGAARRHVLAGGLHELGALPDLSAGDPATHDR